MKQFDEQPLPDDLDAVARRLRESRVDVSELELDEIKLRAMRRGTAIRSGGRPVGRRISALITAAVLAVGGGGAFAVAKQVADNNNKSSASQSQYRGKKCGNPNKPRGVPPGNPSNDDCPSQSSKP
jgi:hypothetical protein